MSNFENDIQNVFEGAEFQPSDRVWAGVEAALTAKKKKGIFFMWQTYGIAAGLAIVFTFGFLYNDGFFNNGTNPPVKELSQIEQEEQTKSTEDPNGQANNDLNKPANDMQRTQASKDDESKSAPSTSSPKSMDVLKELPSNTSALYVGTKKQQNQEEVEDDVNGNIAVLNDRNLTDNPALQESFVSTAMAIAESKPYRYSLTSDILLFNAKMSLDPMSVEALTAKNTKPESAVFRGQKSLNGSLGNSVLNLSSTGFSNSALSADLRDPNNFNTLSASVESGEDQALGAISAGFGFTLDLSRRLSLNLDTRYSEFRFRNTSNAYSVEDGKSLPIYAPIGFNSTNVFFVGDYNLENTIQSVFLQSTFSYRVLNFGKFDVALKAGFGVDYFLAYRIKGDLNFLETRKVNASESDFLNRTNISGVSGLGLNYRLSSSFGLSGDISYRRFVKRQSGDANSTPSSVVGFGLSINYFLNRKED